MPRAPKTPSNRSSNPAPAVSRDEIAREAFCIFQARHGAPGDPVSDWYEAERIVTARASAAARPNPPRAAEAQAGRGGGSRASSRGRPRPPKGGRPRR